MLEQLEKITKIYDLLALCASYILKEYDKEAYEFGTFEESKYEEVYDTIESYVQECESDGSKEAFNTLKKDIKRYLEKGITIERVFAIVIFIDELVEIQLDNSLLKNNHIIKYSALNEQYQDCVKIIPKMSDTILDRGEIQFKSLTNKEYSLFRKARECECSVLDGQTSNYMIWDQEKIKKYPYTIYHFDEKSNMSKHFIDKEKISFGIVPFTNIKLEDILEIKYEKSLFYIDKMYSESEEKLRNRYKDICERSKKRDIDFLIFPEMLLTEDMIFSTRDNESLQQQIVINGSVSKKKINKVIIIDAKKDLICTYCKKEPFEYENKKDKKTYKEWLDYKQNREYSIIEIEGMGRIGVCICKDLLNEDVKLFHKYIKTNILIIPAYTASMDLYSSAESLSKDYLCVVVMVNACSAIDNKKEIGFITLPAKKDTSRSNNRVDYIQDECKEVCTEQCTGKKCEINFYETKQYDMGLSYKITMENF